MKSEKVRVFVVQFVGHLGFWNRGGYDSTALLSDDDVYRDEFWTFEAQKATWFSSRDDAEAAAFGLAVERKDYFSKLAVVEVEVDVYDEESYEVPKGL